MSEWKVGGMQGCRDGREGREVEMEEEDEWIDEGKERAGVGRGGWGTGGEERKEQKRERGTVDGYGLISTG